MNDKLNETINENEQELTVTEAVHRLMRSFRRLHAHGHRHPRGYHRLLKILGEHEGSSARELADLMDIRPASMAELLGKVETEGFITRKKDEKDRRIHRILLTPMGKAHLEEMKEMKADEPIIAGILSPDERQTLIQLCHKLSEGLAEHAETHGREGNV